MSGARQTLQPLKAGATIDMSTTVVAPLADRGVVSLPGPDAVDFLDNLATNDLAGLGKGEARFAGLLTPQGKILFEFFALRTEDGWLLDTLGAKVGELIKRLTLYKLRAKVVLADVSADFAVSAAWGAAPPVVSEGWSCPDPRSAELGWRLLMPRAAAAVVPTSATDADYHRHRIACGIAEGGRDYPLGDTFPHEANYDRDAGVSFTKGCFVGQEVVARMQNKTVVRKRVVAVTGTAPLTQGAEVLIGGTAAIGTIGSVDGTRGLALLRIDRAAEAIEKSQALTTADGAVVTADPAALARYRASAAARVAAP
jgi:folate-binding protein YgfZ